MNNEIKDKNEEKSMPHKKFPNELKVRLTDEIKIKNPIWWREILNIKFLIPTIISLLAICIALNVHSPFKLNVYSSGAYIIPITEGELTYVIPLEFLNEGAKSGTVEDIYLIVEHEGIRSKYLAKYEVDLVKMNQKEYWDTLNYKIKPFQSFGLKDEDTISKAIYFSSENPAEAMIIEEGKYLLKIFIKHSKSEEYSKMLELNLYISELSKNSALSRDIVFLRSPGGYDSTRFSINETNICTSTKMCG